MSEVENHTLTLLREMRADMQAFREETQRGIIELRSELKAFREDAAAADAENAKILATIMRDIADLKTVFTDVQARVIRNEKRGSLPPWQAGQ